MKKLLLLLLFPLFIFQVSIFAGSDPFMGSARSLALGGSTLTLSDPYSILNNQAAMAFQKNISFSLYAEQRYLENELGYYAGGLTLPVKNGAFGLAINYDGFDLFNEKKIGIGYARLFSKNVSGGIQFDYLSTSISEYGTANTFTAELGLLAKVTDQFSVAAHVFNPFAVSSGFVDDKVPTTFQLGVSYEPSKKVFITTEASKDIDNPAQFKAGIEYRVVDALYLRGGFGTNPSRYSFGVGINMKNLKIDLAAAYHQVLGVTPAISLSYAFEKKK